MQQLDQHLWDAASKGQSDKVHTLAEPGADVCAQDVHGRTALCLAALEGHLETLRVMVELGADVGSIGRHKQEELQYAAYKRCTEAVKVLVELGADMYVRDKGGCSASHVAEVQGHTETARVLETTDTSTITQPQVQSLLSSHNKFGFLLCLLL